MAAVPPPTNPYYYGSATPAPAVTNDNGDSPIAFAQTVPQWGDTQLSSNEAVPVAVAVTSSAEAEIVVPPINPLSGEPLSATAESDAATTETAPTPSVSALIGARLEQERTDRELAEKLQREEEQQAERPQQHQQQLVAYQSHQRLQVNIAQNQKLAKLKERRKIRQAVAAGTGTIVGGLLLGPVGAVLVGVSAHQVTKHSGRAAEKRVRKRYEKQEEFKALKANILS